MGPLPKPQTLGLSPSFGYGDRIGLATPGHLGAHLQSATEQAALGVSVIEPIFAQQSIREMQRTHRTAFDVMKSGAKALKHEKFEGAWGGDADHLKTNADVDVTVRAGFTFFTIDPSDHVDVEADDYDTATLDAKFDEIKNRVDWVDEYLGKTITIEEGEPIVFDQVAVRRAAVKYGSAIRHSLSLAAYIKATAHRAGQAHEIEISVDETPQPTTPGEHYIIADQLVRAGVKLVSLAPRFEGDFEKGIDFKGDVASFERSLTLHAAIARQVGPYKLSLHSGSDKLSIYTAFARITRGLFHVKTAGTSYLEALRAVSRHDMNLFRHVVDYSRKHFERDRATYHISATLADSPPEKEVSDDRELVRFYLDEDNGRQILHVTFGTVLIDSLFQPALLGVLKHHPDTYREILTFHFGKHLRALGAGMQA